MSDRLDSQARPSGDNDSGAEDASRRGSPGLILALLAIIILGLTAVAIVNALNQERKTQVARLQAIADLKVRQIADWLEKGQFDAQLIGSSEYLAGHYQRWRAGDAASGEKLRVRLGNHINNQSFAAMTLLDSDGQRLWGSQLAPQQPAPALLVAAAAAAHSGRVQRVGPYRDIDGQLRLDYITPLASGAGPHGLVVLHADLAHWLYPALQTWPVPSPSGESLLLRRDGDDVQYINELRHRRDTALQLRQALMTPELLSARVLRGEVRPDQLVTGHDYRIVPVVGVARAVPGSDWILIAKVDRQELYGEAMGDIASISLTGLLLLFVLGAVLILQRQREQLTLETVRREAQAERLGLFDNMMNGFAHCRMLYEDGRPVDFIYLSVNRAFATQTGLRDVVGRRVSELIPDIRESDPALIEIYGRVAAEGAAERFEIYLNAMQQWFEVAAYCPQHGHFVAVFDVITKRKQAEAQLRQSEAQLHALAAQLLAVREAERIRIARHVHDELGQLLTGLSMDLAWLERRIARIGDGELRQPMEDKIVEVEELTQKMLTSVQEIASELRPDVLDHLGICAALRHETERFTRRSGIACALDLPAVPLPLAPDTATALFRIVQECLANVARHAGATQIDISVAKSGTDVRLEVRDNGCGISPQQLADPASLGLLGMRERTAQLGGRLSIVGEPGRGTTVTATVPA
jgi:signal transduction histidine kinase